MNNTLIECSDDSYSQAQNTYIVKSFLWKGPPTVKVRKKIIDQMLGHISFCFEIRAHLVRLFA